MHNYFFKGEFMERIKLHDHPKMEKEKHIDEEHVIIDRDAYLAIRKLLGKDLYNILEYKDRISA